MDTHKFVHGKPFKMEVKITRPLIKKYLHYFILGLQMQLL